MNPLYNIWNYDYIQQQARQIHHQEQIYKVADTANKLREFLKSSDDVEPLYRDALLFECCAVLMEYANKHNMF